MLILANLFILTPLLIAFNYHLSEGLLSAMDSILNEAVIKSFSSGLIDSHAPLARRLIIPDLSQFLFFQPVVGFALKPNTTKTVILAKEWKTWVKILMKNSLGRVTVRVSSLSGVWQEGVSGQLL